MTPSKLKKIAVLIPTFILSILLIQQNYDWIFGLFIGTALAFSSCELIQKAVSNSFHRKVSRAAKVFLVGFFFRFFFFAALLYFAIIQFQVNVIAITISFTVVQLFYPFYLIRSLEQRNNHV